MPSSTTSAPCAPDGLDRAESALYRALQRLDGQVATKAQLIADLPDVATTRALDALADRLRSKLRDAEHPLTTANVWGVGYRLAPRIAPSAP